VNQKTLWAQQALGLTQRQPEQPRDARGRFEPQHLRDPHGRVISNAPPPFDAGPRGGPPRKADPLHDHANTVLALIRAKRLRARRETPL
jgi:hypothetical protein